MQNESRGPWPKRVDETAPSVSEIAALQKSIDCYYRRTMDQRPLETPTFSFWFGRRRLIVAAQMQDAVSDSLEITLQDQTLWVRGSLRQAGRPCGDVWLQGSPQRFSRCIQLPYSVDTESLKASWVSGVLLIHGLRQPAAGAA